MGIRDSEPTVPGIGVRACCGGSIQGPGKDMDSATRAPILQALRKSNEVAAVQLMGVYSLDDSKDFPGRLNRNRRAIAAIIPDHQVVEPLGIDATN